jgi:hypothetical protein
LSCGTDKSRTYSAPSHPDAWKDRPCREGPFYDFAFDVCIAAGAADPFSVLRQTPPRSGLLGSMKFVEEAGDRFLDYPYRRKVVKESKFETNY